MRLKWLKWLRVWKGLDFWGWVETFHACHCVNISLSSTTLGYVVELRDTLWIYELVRSLPYRHIVGARLQLPTSYSSGRMLLNATQPTFLVRAVSMLGTRGDNPRNNSRHSRLCSSLQVLPLEICILVTESLSTYHNDSPAGGAGNATLVRQYRCNMQTCELLLRNIRICVDASFITIDRGKSLYTMAVLIKSQPPVRLCARLLLQSRSTSDWQR